MPRIRNDTDTSCVTFPGYPLKTDFQTSPNEDDEEDEDSDVVDPLVLYSNQKVPEITEESESGNTVRFEIDQNCKVTLML